MTKTSGVAPYVRGPSPDGSVRETEKGAGGELQRFAVFIRDPASVEEFVGLARIDTEAEDEAGACERALTLHAEFSEAPIDNDDVALCARLAKTGLSNATAVRPGVSALVLIPPRGSLGTARLRRSYVPGTPRVRPDPGHRGPAETRLNPAARRRP
jgi:hypothetical protein